MSRWLALLIALAPLRCPAQGVLDREVTNIHLTTSVEAFRATGVTIDDAVLWLRQHVAFPICLESLDFDGDKDNLTLGDVLDEFHALTSSDGLTSEAESRLKTYENMVLDQSRATNIGMKERTFTVVENHMTIRAYLDRITQLDSEYRWKNAGTGAAPLIVIQPRDKSALDWTVRRICGTPQEMSAKRLFGPHGRLAVLFSEHGVIRAFWDGTAELPDIPIDLCRDGLTARDVLNRTILVSGGGASWSLSGIKGVRFLNFDRSP